MLSVQRMVKNTSWHNVHRWYADLVGTRGQYYHEHVVLPGASKLLNFSPHTKLLDLGCGQGILSRSLPKEAFYVGVDAAKGLIEEAKRLDKRPNHRYVLADVTKEIPLKEYDFTHATILLALQNMKEGDQCVKNAAKHLRIDGKLLIVLNHPCFRIPRQSGWGIDEGKKLQYRRIDRYLSPMMIPITMHPGQGKNSPVTWSFHYPLETYFSWINKAGLVVSNVEEWSSTKESEGKAAKMENRSRAEIPLFLAILAEKK